MTVGISTRGYSLAYQKTIIKKASICPHLVSYQATQSTQAARADKRACWPLLISVRIQNIVLVLLHLLIISTLNVTVRRVSNILDLISKRMHLPFHNSRPSFAFTHTHATQLKELHEVWGQKLAQSGQLGSLRYCWYLAILILLQPK